VANTDAPLPPDAQTTPTRRSRIKSQVSGGLTENLWLKLTAVGLAILLWFTITNREPTAKSVTVQLRLSLDSSLVLRTPPEEINAVVQGAPIDLLKLGSRSATISEQINASAPDTFVIDLSPKDVELPPSVAGLLTVTDIYPKSVTLEFVRTLTRRVPVRSGVQVVAVSGGVVPRVIVEPSTVEISGPRLVVNRVDFVRTDTTRILATDSMPHQVGIDTTGLGIRAKPEQVHVRLAMPRKPKP
jgi:YbbR domain-containing protein